MKTLTKDQIGRLSPEHLDALATVEACRAKREARLRRQAHRYWGQHLVPGLGAGMLVFVPLFSAERLTPFFVALFLWSIFQFQAAGINRRLDALVELLESESKEDPDGGS